MQSLQLPTRVVTCTPSNSRYVLIIISIHGESAQGARCPRRFHVRRGCGVFGAYFGLTWPPRTRKWHLRPREIPWRCTVSSIAVTVHGNNRYRSQFPITMPAPHARSPKWLRCITFRASLVSCLVYRAILDYLTRVLSSDVETSTSLRSNDQISRGRHAFWQKRSK